MENETCLAQGTVFGGALGYGVMELVDGELALWLEFRNAG